MSLRVHYLRHLGGKIFQMFIKITGIFKEHQQDVSAFIQKQH